MADKKHDCYSDWLGIPAGPRPPNHYVLLGLEPNESDPKKISEAAAARLRLVRQYGLRYPKESTELLNEIAAAEVCLLDLDSKAKYDQSLQNQTTPVAVAAAAPAVVMWYLQRDERVYGPIPDHQLREMAKSGYVGADDLVWNEQLAQWSAARTIDGLVFKRAPRQPPSLEKPAPRRDDAAGKDAASS